MATAVAASNNVTVQPFTSAWLSEAASSLKGRVVVLYHDYLTPLFERIRPSITAFFQTLFDNGQQFLTDNRREVCVFCGGVATVLIVQRLFRRSVQNP